MMVETNLADALKRRNNMSISKLARLADLSRESVSKTMDGDYTQSKVSTLLAIEAALPGLKLVIRFEDELPDTVTA